MLTKIRERTQDALLREELLCGEANFRSLAEAIACAIFISPGKRLPRIRSRLATDNLQPLLSASIGVAVHPQDGETIEALLCTADRELYGMKSPWGEEPTPLVRSFVSSPGRLVHKKTPSKKSDQAYDLPEGESWIH